MAITKGAKSPPAKRSSLLDELDTLVVNRRASRGWAANMEQDDPEGYANILEISEDFNRRGKSYRKFGTATALYDYLISREALPSGVSNRSYRQYLHDLSRSVKLIGAIAHDV